MKEATGELNMTVVTVVAIAAVAAFFYMFVWPAIQTTIIQNTKCATASCDGSVDGDGMLNCKYMDDQGDWQDFLCPVTSNQGSKTAGN